MRCGKDPEQFVGKGLANLRHFIEKQNDILKI